MNITIDSIQNHGTVIQILGHDRDDKLVSVVGDWRMMDSAIEGLGLAPGVRCSYEQGALAEPMRCEHDTEEVCAFCRDFRSDVDDNDDMPTSNALQLSFFEED